MATTTKALYGANAQAITCTLASLANASMRQSTAVDNTVNLYLDALVQVKFKTAVAGVTSTGQVNVYAYGTADGGSSYTDGVTGTDGAFTPTNPTNLKLIGTINANANAIIYTGGPFSVAAGFGGILPDHWGIVVENQTGAAADATEGNFQKVYQGVQAQNV